MTKRIYGTARKSRNRWSRRFATIVIIAVREKITFAHTIDKGILNSLRLMSGFDPRRRNHKGVGDYNALGNETLEEVMVSRTRNAATRRSDGEVNRKFPAFPKMYLEKRMYTINRRYRYSRISRVAFFTNTARLS